MATLFLVATPIGNLNEVSNRCLETLRSVKVIACEDTRNTRKLLSHFDIHTPLISYHNYNEELASGSIIEYLENGDDVALVSDAGYPLISDPGYVLVNEVIEKGFNINTVSGPNACLNALVASGLSVNHYMFYGFLNSKSSSARKELEELKNFPYTIVFYEAPHRIKKTVELVYEVFGDRKAVIARELTKIHEEYIRGNLSELVNIGDLKGEIVFLVEGYKHEETEINFDALKNEVLNLVDNGLKTKVAISEVASKYKVSKNELYDYYHKSQAYNCFMNRFKLLIKDYRKESILAPLFKLLESLFDLFVPLVIAGIINKGINNNDFGYVVKMFILLILLAIIGLACSIVAQYFAAKASVGFTTKLRQMLFEHIQSFSYQNLDEIGQDTLITRLTSDTNQIQNGLNLALRLLLRSPFIVFGAMIMAFTINVKCALIFAVVIPLLCLVVFLIMIKSIPLFKEVQVALDGLLSKTRENLSGIRVIRAFRIEDKEFNEFKDKNDLLTRKNQRVGFLSALTNPLTYILINMATVILIYTGTIEVRMYGLAQGDVVALYNYMAQIVVELVKMANLIITIDKSLACFSRVEKVLDIEPDMKYVDSSPDSCPGSNLTFDNVSFTYPNSKEACLENISFSINKGETLGIIGPTGCGKTSLVNLIYRAYDPSVGTVYLDGVDIKSYSKDELVNKVSVVPQKAALFKESIRDNLRMADPDVSEEKMWEALDIAQAKEIVLNKEGQLDHMIEQGGKNLSGGQRQRLSIARALCKDFDILILDDSFSALDYQTEAKLRMALKTLNKTIVNVSQRASSIKNADKILVLDDGKLVGFGNHDELMKSCELYKEIYYSQYPFEKEASHE